MANEVFTPEQVRDALLAEGGSIKKAAERLNCHYFTVRNYRNKYQIVREVVRTHTGNPRKCTDEEILKALEETDGNAESAAKVLGYNSAQVIYERLRSAGLSHKLYEIRHRKQDGINWTLKPIVLSDGRYKCPACEKVMSRQGWYFSHPCRFTK